MMYMVKLGDERERERNKRTEKRVATKKEEI